MGNIDRKIHRIQFYIQNSKCKECWFIIQRKHRFFFFSFLSSTQARKPLHLIVTFAHLCLLCVCSTDFNESLCYYQKFGTSHWNQLGSVLNWHSDCDWLLTGSASQSPRTDKYSCGKIMAAKVIKYPADTILQTFPFFCTLAHVSLCSLSLNHKRQGINALCGPEHSVVAMTQGRKTLFWRISSRIPSSWIWQIWENTQTW